jgi:hypothetical protein
MSQKTNNLQNAILRISRWVFVLMGAGSAFYQFFRNRSLWLDEASLALNIVERSWTELISPSMPLLNNQAAPVGFLLLSKLGTTFFGEGEFGLRVVPLISYCLSLFLFNKIANRHLKPTYALVAVIFFTLSPTLFYYATELKPYSSDITWALGLCCAFSFYIERQTRRRLIIITSLGFISQWFSFPIVFVLAGLGVTILFAKWRGDLTIKVKTLVGVASLWTFNFLIHYVVFLRMTTGNNAFQRYWTHAFLPAPTNMEALESWAQMTMLFFKYSDQQTGWTVLFIILSLISVKKAVKEKNYSLLGFSIPPLFVVIANLLKIYPLEPRLILFTLPLSITLVVNGLQVLAKDKSRFFNIVLVFVFIVPTLRNVSNLTRPAMREELRPLLKFINENRKSNELVYVYYGSSSAVLYYSRLFQFDKSQYVYGKMFRNNPQEYGKEIQSLTKKGRAWIVFSHYWKNERKLILENFEGEILITKQTVGASIFLLEKHATK